MVGRAAFVFARDFLSAIELFLVPECSDWTLSFEIAGLATIDRHILHTCVRLCRRFRKNRVFEFFTPWPLQSAATQGGVVAIGEVEITPIHVELAAPPNQANKQNREPPPSKWGRRPMRDLPPRLYLPARGGRMKLRWSWTSIGGTLMMLVGLTAVASSRAQTFDGCLGAGRTLNRVSEGMAPSDPATSTLVSWNELGPQGPRATTGPECYSALCGRPFSFTRLSSIPLISD